MLLTTQETADVFRVAKSTIADPRWRRRVGLLATRIGGRLLFDEDDVKNVIQRGKTKMPTTR